VPDPYGDAFVASKENRTREWSPSLTTLRKDEYASVIELSTLDE
jgi:hypothetical protein